MFLVARAQMWTAALVPQGDLISRFQRRVAACNDVSQLRPVKPFFVGAALAGEVDADIAVHLGDWPDIFDISDPNCVRLTESCAALNLEERSAQVAIASSGLRDRGLVKAWRDEPLAVRTRFDAPPVLKLERACVPLFGAKGYGVAINGYARHPETQETWLWVARRADDKPTWPGMLDVLAAGALPAGVSPTEQACREAEDEAGLTRELALRARSCGAVSYRGVDEWGQLKRDVRALRLRTLPISPRGRGERA